MKKYDSITHLFKSKSRESSSLSSSEKRANKYSHLIIHPENDYKIIWDFFIGILILYTVIVVPLQIGLNINYGRGGNIFDHFIDAFFAIDMIITFFTAFEVDGKMKRNLTLIANNYFKTWFFLDLISTIPFDSIISPIVNGISPDTLRTIKLVRALRLFRLLKLIRIFRLNRKLKDAKVIENIHPIVYQVVGLFTNIFFIAHLLACIYYYIAACDEYPDHEDIWRTCGHRNNSYSQYLVSIYWVMTTIFAVGYGDVVLDSERGRLFSIFVMFIGSLNFGFVVATVSECIETWNPRVTARKLKMDEMLAYCNERGFVNELKISILKHYDYYYNKTTIFSEETILHSLPILLHQSLIEHSHENSLNHLNLFQKEEHSTLTSILPHLKPTCVEPREVIVSENDYLVDMIFIMRGAIHASLQNSLSSNRLVLVGIFGPGSDFGCSNALDGKRLSWATYRATVVTDLMWLDYKVIQDSTNRMKELFTKRSIEEEKNQQEVIKYVDKTDEVGLLRVPAYILCDGQVISCRHAIRMLGEDSFEREKVAKVYKTVYLRGKDMNGNDVYEEDQETTLQMRNRLVINPYSSYKIKFDTIISIFALYSAITIPLRLGFHLPQNIAWNIIDTFTELLFSIDLILAFFTAYEQSDYSLNTVHKNIARRYLKSWFLIDFLSAIPFYRLSKAAKVLQALKLCKLFRAIRIFRLASLGKLYRFISNNDEVTFNSEMIALQDGLNRVIFSIGFVGLFTHLCACFWSWISLDAEGRTWYTVINILNTEYLKKYIAATYWSYTTLATVGYGDIVAENDGERLYTILIFITGSSLLAYVVGLVRAYAFNRNGSKSLQEEQLNLVRHYLTEQGISKTLKEAIMKHFANHIEHKTPYNENLIWKNLPHRLRQESILAVYNKSIEKLHLFSEHFKISVLSVLLMYLEPSIATRGSYVYTFETGCDGLYFILDGTAEVIDEDEQEKEVIVAQIRKGMFFGHERILGLTTDFLGIRAMTSLKMLFLRNKNIEHIKHYYPLVYSTLIKTIDELLLKPSPIKGINGVGGGGRHNPILEFNADQQRLLAELIANPNKNKLQSKRSLSKQSSSIEEAIVWFAQDMDETIPTERGVTLMGEVLNPFRPSRILSLNSKDHYKTMKVALKTALNMQESFNSDDSDYDDRNENDIGLNFLRLSKSGKQHYAKIQREFHPRRNGVERKYIVANSLKESVHESKSSNNQEQGSLNDGLSETKLQSVTGNNVIESSTNPLPLPLEPSFHPPHMSDDASYRFSNSSDSHSDRNS